MGKYFRKFGISVDVNEILSVIKDIEWDTQLCVTSRDGKDLFDGNGSIANTGLYEKDFSVINEPFKGTCIESALDEVRGMGYGYGRVRFMKLRPKRCYSYHTDTEARLHLAIQSSNNDFSTSQYGRDQSGKSFLIVDGEMIEIPLDGEIYMVDTQHYHTALNCGSSDRIHLVIALLYPVTKLGDEYEILGKRYSEVEFQKWKQQEKPFWAEERIDYYYV